MNASTLLIPAASPRDPATTAGSRRPSKAPPVEPFATKLARSRGEPGRESARRATEPRESPASQPPSGQSGRDVPASPVSTPGEASKAPSPADASNDSSRTGDDVEPSLPPKSQADLTAMTAPGLAASMADVTGVATPVMTAEEISTGVSGRFAADSEMPASIGAVPQSPSLEQGAPAGPDPASLASRASFDRATGEGIASSPPVDATAAGSTGEATSTRPEEAARPPTVETSSTRVPAPGAAALNATAGSVEAEPADGAGNLSPTDDAKAGEELADGVAKTLSRAASLDQGSQPGTASHVNAAAPPVAAKTALTGTTQVQSAMPQPAIRSNDDEAARQNIDRIVNGVRGELLPRGGSMQIRLDPPQLGSLQVTVRVQDGVLSASFQTASEQATQMLSQGMTQLKSALESSGVSVERLHVQQAPPSRSSDDARGSGGEGRHQQGAGEQQSWAQNEQQRREMLQRMWRRLGLASDPLDLVA